jgi:hypothetical protein
MYAKNSTCDKNNNNVDNNSMAHRLRVAFIGVFKKIMVVTKNITSVDIIIKKFIVVICKKWFLI